MTFKPLSRRCHKCNKPVYILTEDQQEVTCECGVKYRVIKVADYSIEEISESDSNQK